MGRELVVGEGKLLKHLCGRSRPPGPQRVTLIKESEKKRIVSEYINEGLVMQPTQM